MDFATGLLRRFAFGLDAGIGGRFAVIGFVRVLAAAFRAVRTATALRRATGADFRACAAAGRLLALRAFGTAVFFELTGFARFFDREALRDTALSVLRDAAVGLALRTTFFAATRFLTGFAAPNLRSVFSTSCNFFIQARRFFSSFLRSFRAFLVMSVMVVSYRCRARRHWSAETQRRWGRSFFLVLMLVKS